MGDKPQEIPTGEPTDEQARALLLTTLRRVGRNFHYESGDDNPSNIDAYLEVPESLEMGEHFQKLIDSFSKGSRGSRVANLVYHKSHFVEGIGEQTSRKHETLELEMRGGSYGIKGHRKYGASYLDPVEEKIIGIELELNLFKFFIGKHDFGGLIKTSISKDVDAITRQIGRGETFQIAATVAVLIELSDLISKAKESE